MAAYQPLYSITPTILNRVIQIGELLGCWSSQSKNTSPLLRKENQIRTIQASVAIEYNSLSTEQVTAIMDGKRVLAPAKDIQEVRNAILDYEKLPEWQSYQLADLLAAHHLLMGGLVDRPEKLRCSDVGIYRENQLIHMAPPASQVSRLISELLMWLKQTDIHPLISGAIFHYEFEFIHPFADGNGRMGRLWQTLILSEWRPELAWLPVETLIHHQQQEYYQVLRKCDRAGDCTLFIDFMLEKLVEVLKEGINTKQQSVAMSVENLQLLNVTSQKILLTIVKQPAITISQLADKLEVSCRTVERNIKVLQENGHLIRVGAKKTGYWQVKK
ncbi:Fic family protein [Xenorhabdus budapestensis]|uniref:Fic family protein n=1 Tax=Xenorhabdus budapestensis TaxID=290110 RepID=UPI003A851ACD